MNALVALAPYLPGLARHEAMEEALNTAGAINNERQRAEALASLATAITPSQHAAWLDAAAAAAARMPRDGALGLIESSIPVIHAFAGSATLGQVRRAVLDVARWYR